MKKAVIYGAGNIGRGFIGQLFSQSGYEVVFIDVNREIVKKLNEDQKYPVQVVSEQGHKEIIIENVRAVDGTNIERVADEIAGAEIMATAVGVNILSRITRPIALGLKRRWQQANLQPFNIIICENLLDANHYLGKLLKRELDTKEKKLFDETIGLVEASIGRMVPVMTPQMQGGNILRICVEEYCELPVDKDGFKGNIPNIVNMIPFSPFEFYIRRKLFIHNMGHALTAYLGYLQGYQYLWQAISNPYIKLLCKRAMFESATALSVEYDIALETILEHVEDLLYRFGNQYLEDTVARVGKDPIRKLSANDRLLGAGNLCVKQGIMPVYISVGIAAGLHFNEQRDEAAQKIQRLIEDVGVEDVLKEVSGLSENSMIWEHIILFYIMMQKNKNIEEILALAERIKNEEVCMFSQKQEIILQRYQTK